ncbi:HEAT repeat domain-containing protein [Streptodolium elevatio]|uniref:HEAT repeat domain-containing protein n=1 Tax=Streptodolium elevatio TaxID=3157996 RepID=A0ABV3DEC7_9ACTN
MATDHVDGLMRDLGDPERRGAAVNTLVALAGDAVPALLRELTREAAPPSWYACGTVLGEIGMTGFDQVFEALVAARTPEARHRIGRVFGGYGLPALAQYTAALRHPDPDVRSRAANAIGHCGEDALSAAETLLGLLADPDREVASSAGAALVFLGDGVVPLLQRVRRDGPGRLRPRVLPVLADIGGEAVLPTRDLRAVERLIRIKLLDDRPQPSHACWMNWLAVSSGDQAGIMDALDLTDPRPVTFALGNDIVDADGHGRHDEDHDCFDRVFVTPELDGWTFVMGSWCDPGDAERSDDVLRLCLLLSARFGKAQAYYYGAQGDGSGWLIAENGAVVRRYCETGDADDELLTLGDPLPLERLRREELGLAPDWHAAEEEQDAEDAWKSAAFGLAPEVAAAYGISPLAIGPDTPVRGTGVVALTPYATNTLFPAGAHPI